MIAYSTFLPCLRSFEWIFLRIKSQSWVQETERSEIVLDKETKHVMSRKKINALSIFLLNNV